MILEPRAVSLTTRTGTTVDRLLPQARLRRIGAWVFADLFGPLESDTPMSVGAHPHTGLQTATWLFSGEVVHNDTLATYQKIVPQQLNLMTAGQGIAHSELQTQSHNSLHAIQLWIALPDAQRNCAPHFDHYANLPTVKRSNFSATVFVGDFLEVQSPARVHSPLVGVELNIEANSQIVLPLIPEFEYGFIAITGGGRVASESIEAKQLVFLEGGVNEVAIESGNQPLRMILLGGAAFNEPLVMWWNFIARSHEEIVEMRTAWETNNQRFGNVAGPLKSRIPAPELPPVELKAR